jgi:polyhydroxybutyrate depolymerase
MGRRKTFVRFVLLFLILLLIVVFAVRRLRAQATNAHIEVQGATRTYLVHLPKNYSSSHKWPVVFVLHGGNDQGRGMDVVTHFNDFADQQGIIAVYPEGLNRGWDDGRVSRRLAPRTADDVGFISALTDKLEADYSVDGGRVYVTGISNGGFMSFRLGCDLAGRIAAIAPVAATFPIDLTNSCHPARPIPLLMINGTADPLVPYQGGEVIADGGKIMAAEKSAEKWAQMNGCSSSPSIVTLPPKSADGLATRITRYTNCKFGADVELRSIEGGGHTWPGGFQYLPERLIGETSREFSANEEIWKFFAAHPMPTASH